MRQIAAILPLAAAVLLGCTGTTSTTVPAVDSGNAPASAYAECGASGASGPPDAPSIAYTATCALALDNGLPQAGGAGPATCEEWSESEDGDWTPFIASCLDAGGSITSAPCPDAGLLGACVLAPTCTDQTTVFYYETPDAAGTASARSACGAIAGGTFSP